jgi:site-specific recombinase XerD
MIQNTWSLGSSTKSRKSGVKERKLPTSEKCCKNIAKYTTNDRKAVF